MTFYPALFEGRVLLPLDQLNTMTLPYSASHSTPAAQNTFLLDAVTQYYPYKSFIREAILQGIPALWNPYVFGGYPMYADTMAAYFDVTNLVLACCDAPTAYDLQSVLQLFIGGAGMYALLRFYRVSAVTSVLFGTAYMLNSMFITGLLVRALPASFCWVPLILLVLAKYSQQGRARHLALAAIFTALAFLGGTFQTDLYVLFVIAVFGVFGLRRMQSRRHFTRYAPVLVAIFLGLTVSAVMWVPSLESLWLTVNDGTSPIQMTGTSACETCCAGCTKQFSMRDSVVDVPLLVSFFVPQLAGSPQGFDLTKLGNTTMAEFTGSPGFVPLLFGLAGAATLWRRQPAARPYIVLMVMGLLIPLATPLYKVVYHRFFIVFILGAVVLGAFKFDELVLNPMAHRREIKHLLTIASALTLVVLVGLGVTTAIVDFNYERIHAAAVGYVQANLARGQTAVGNEAWMLSRVDTLLQHFSLTSPTMHIPLCLVLLSLGVLAFHWYGRREISRFVAPALLLLTFAQLVVFARSWLPMVDPNAYPVYAETSETRFLEAERDVSRVLPYTGADSQRVFQPNILSMYGISTISGYVSIVPSALSRLLDNNLNARMLGLIGVKYIAASGDAQLPDGSLELAYQGAVDIYRVPDVVPRFYLVHQYEVVADRNTALARVAQGDADRNLVILEEAPDPAVGTPSAAAVDADEISLTEAASNSLSMRVEVARSAILVVSDSFYPGWRVWVNGQERTVLRANGAMRAVVVDAGASTVEWRFEPLSFLIGLVATVIGLAVCMGMIVVSRDRGTDSSDGVDIANLVGLVDHGRGRESKEVEVVRSSR